MSNTYDYCIIGAGGFVGHHLVMELRRRGLRVLRVTSRLEETGQPDTLVWNYQTAPPIGLSSASTIINCAKSPTWGKAKELINHLRASLIIGQQRYVHLSSNAVFARARGLWGHLLSGDDYIRGKRLEAKYTHQQFPADAHLVVYPGVLLGANGGWDSFLHEVSRARCIQGWMPATARSESIDIDQFCVRLVDAITSRRTGDLCIPEAEESTPTWEALLRGHASPETTFVANGPHYLFFRNKTKEALMRLLTLRLLPNFIALGAFRRLRQRQAPVVRSSGPIEVLHIEGMTKYYISQAPK